MKIQKYASMQASQFDTWLLLYSITNNVEAWDPVGSEKCVKNSADDI